MAHAGLGSRRAVEELILKGRVTINGETVRELATKVDPRRDKIAVDGQRVEVEPPVYIAVNKPKGYVSTNSDPSGRPRVVDLVPSIPQRVYTVGRLDEMSIGLILLTNDGELANKLSHPKFGVEKVYRAVVAGHPSREVLDKLVEGVWLAEGKARAKHVKMAGTRGDSTILEMVLAEGKNREVRRMLAKLGHKVMSLSRVAVGPIVLKGLKPGHFRFLSKYEVDLLRKVADGIPVPSPRFGDRRPDRAPARPGGRPTGPGSRSRPGLASPPPPPPPRPSGPPPGPAQRRPPQRPMMDEGNGPRPPGPPPGPRSRRPGPPPPPDVIPMPRMAQGGRPPRPASGPRPASPRPAGPRSRQDGPGPMPPRPPQRRPPGPPPRPEAGPLQRRIIGLTPPAGPPPDRHDAAPRPRPRPLPPRKRSGPEGGPPKRARPLPPRRRRPGGPEGAGEE